MPNSNRIQDEITKASSPDDQVRRRYLKELHDQTNRNVIVYYSGWLTATRREPAYSISDHDKIGLMSACNGIDRKLGLDLILHTPGGDIAATESIVDYLKQMFDDIRVVVPQLAMSAGTMIACSAHRILMGKQSSLGPIAPQIGGIPAHGAIEEFTTAMDTARKDPSTIPLLQIIVGKYQPTFIGECQKAITWSENMVGDWLRDRMLHADADADAKIKAILDELGQHSNSLNHARHYSAKQCQDLGLKVEMMEDNQNLQDAILSVHHATMHTISNSAKTPILKIIENHNGAALITKSELI